MPGFMRGPGEGPAYDFHGSQVVIKASGDDTLGQLSVMEFSYPPGLSVHPHVHQRHGFTVTSPGPALAVVITGPARLDRQIAARAAREAGRLMP
jgi:quercetin dioxygenase-like cupin family protein